MPLWSRFVSAFALKYTYGKSASIMKKCAFITGTSITAYYTYTHRHQWFTAVSEKQEKVLQPGQEDPKQKDNNSHVVDARRKKKESESEFDDPFYRSKHNQKARGSQSKVAQTQEDIVLFTGNANKELATEIVSHLGSKLGNIHVGRFTDGEVNVQVIENVRGKDVYVIQPTCPPVNENLVELLLIISTLRRASARKITAVIPYYGYARQDRKLSSRVPISAADVARLLETMGVDRVIAVDLHCGQIQGFFGPRVPVDNLEARVVGVDYFVETPEIQDIDNLVIVSPDAGGVYRARKFQQSLIDRGFQNVGIAMIIKQRAKASEIERMDLVGTVQDSDCIIIDDMIDTAGTLCQAAKELKRNGAKRVYAFATHGLFSGNAYERITESTLEKVITTNTIPKSEKIRKSDSNKFVQLSVGLLLAETIRRIHQKESVSEIFSKYK